ncbi:MAG: DNA polymerase I [Planctomycetota bacterium]|jgi:DNA polymerase-1
MATKKKKAKRPAAPRARAAKRGKPAPAPQKAAVPLSEAAAGVKKLYLIDGHAVLYRAYFAIKTKLAAPGTGQPTHAAFGFTRIVRAMLAEHSPDYLVVCMDAPGPTFRHERYDDYKANRPSMPDDLSPQIGMVERVMDAYGIPVIRAQGYEADDVLGTLAEAAAAQRVDVVIVSGDKDVLQLVKDGAGKDGGTVAAFDPTPSGKGGPRGGEFLDSEGVERKKGVPPEKLIDVFGLAGDSSDNIPGVPGVGPKTAVKLVQKYGSLEAALAGAAEGKEKGKLRERLVEHADQARLSRELATIRTDAPVELDLEAARAHAHESDEKLMAVFRELGFRAFLKELAPSGHKEDLRYETVDTPKALEKFVKKLSGQERFAVDLETDSQRPRGATIVGLSFSWKPKEGYYIPVRAPLGERALDEGEVLAKLGPILEDPKRHKVGQNAKYDMIVLRRAGVAMRGLDFDTMVASYLLDAGSRSHGIDALALQHLGFRKIATTEIIGKGREQTTMDRVPVDKVARYACEDADIAWRLCGVLEKGIRDRGLEELYRELELPLVDVLAEIEWNGIAVDGEALAGLAAGMADGLAIEEKAIHGLAGEEFAIASTKQLNAILYEKLGLPILKRTPKGAPSTDADVLRRLSGQHELPKAVMRYRELAKLKSTYADSLPGYVNAETGRIHASLHQAVTATGRLSSSDPNLQNIPIRSESGRAIRQCFIAGHEGAKLLSADYSQVELRLLAHLSGDERLVKAFRDGRDIHAAVAAEMGGVAIDKVTSDMRRRAKTVNFGLIYGQGAQHLARSTGMTVKEADSFISEYFRRFAGVKRFRAKVLEDAREEGRVVTMLGRVRYIPDINSDDVAARRGAERMAFNTVIQGSAADLMKRAMIDIHRDMSAKRMRSRMILQIHDELLFESPERELEALRGLVEERMAGAFTLKVPLVVDSGVGDNWLDLE